jgi:6-phosphogluconolactonase
MRSPILNLLLLASSAVAAPVFIGTGDKAIYLADFDAKSGKLTEPVAVADYNGPGFLALHPSKPVLYAVGSPNTPFEDKSGAVAAFAIGSDHKLTFLGEASSSGKGACHVAVDATGKTVAIANYGDGTASTLKLDDKGVPQAGGSVIKKTGSGPSDRQKGPHSHGVYFDKSNKFLFEPDLGVDKVFVYEFNAADSTIKEKGALATKPGAGPRHMTFSPDEKHAYVINELDNTIQVASYDGKGGLETIQTVPTLPADFTAKSTTAEVEVHPNGKFVYGSNRGHDSIAVYSRDTATGKLTFVQHAPCGGKVPRHFTIDPSGKWMLIGHQDSNTISVLALDAESGKLGEPTGTVSTPKPICILFTK